VNLADYAKILLLNLLFIGYILQPIIG